MIDDVEPPPAGRIWTIGHGRLDFDSLGAVLSNHLIQTIVDVRSEPYSKWAPDFAKDALEDAAASAGFGYRWMGRQLGGKPPAAPEVRAGGIDELVGLAATSRVVLLCAEVDPNHCHRDSILSPEIVARGYEVSHILQDGRATPYQDHLDL